MMDFFSLELSDTNAIDHNTYDYSSQNISFEIVDKWNTFLRKRLQSHVCKVTIELRDSLEAYKKIYIAWG